jgi:hypothetical protein
MSSNPDRNAADAAFTFGWAWFERGCDDAAAEHFSRALDRDPDHPRAHRGLAYLKIRAADLAGAVTHMAAAVRMGHDDEALAIQFARLRELAGLAPEPADLPANPDGRIRFTRRLDWQHHRSGWAYALGALYPLHNPNGIRFEDFVEEPFGWDHPTGGVRSGPELLEALRRPTYEGRLTAEERRVIPIREPWIGVFHNPPGMPRDYHYKHSPQAIMAKPVWRESAKACLGLFALSEYHAEWLRRATGKPVSALLHPTERPERTFDFDRFAANRQKQIIQIGWWLRSQSAIYRLPIPADNPLGYRKLRLVPNVFPGADKYLRMMIARELFALGQPAAEAAANTAVRRHVSDAEYDELLSANIVLVQLLDASANNTVVECLARATPILVNPLPAVREYLGEDYPLYFDDLDQAAAMALDTGRLRAAHLHLAGSAIRDRLDAASFRRSFEDSEVVRGL